MQWLIVVLLPKGGGDYYGIGLLDPFWKVVEVIMDKMIQVIEFYDSLYGFLLKRGDRDGYNRGKAGGTACVFGAAGSLYRLHLSAEGL